MKNDQSGRSLIEMITVLTVVGALTVVSMKAYAYIMDSHKMSQTITELNERYCSARYQVDAQHDYIDLSEFEDKTSQGYTVTSQFNQTKDFFDFKVENVDKKMCESIILSDWVAADETRINNHVYHDGEKTFCSEGKNIIVHRFAVADIDSNSDIAIPFAE